MDEAYRDYPETLLRSGRRCSAATHDPVLLDHAHRFVRENGLDPNPRSSGCCTASPPSGSVRCAAGGTAPARNLVHVEEWYLYLCHRGAEHPPNIYQAVVDVAGGLPCWTSRAAGKT